MFRKISVVLMLAMVLIAAALWMLGGREIYALHRATSPATALQDYALQDDSKVVLPVPEAQIKTSYSALKNVYWGDLHVHTLESFDAVLFGTTLTVEDAYRFARGDPLRSDGGELMQLSRPLDFVAITDHAEGFGLRSRCRDEALSLMERFHCALMEKPNVLTFLALKALSTDDFPAAAMGAEPGVYRKQPRKHPTLMNWPICNLDKNNPERCFQDSISDWSRYKRLAEQYNQPGTLTTFAAYEYSPPLPKAGKHHRNVIFNGTDLPEHATSYFDTGSAIGLWQTLEKDCFGACDFLTIPHNMNKSWGLFYSPHTWDGQTYSKSDWLLRMRHEPLAEIYQVKGASECALGVGAADEECSFSQVLQPCAPGQHTGCAFTSSFARQGLKIGLQLHRELGANPLSFGFIGATDTHNANPGDAEEWDFVGKVATASSPAIRRNTEWEGREPYESMLQFHTSGGLAAVWAEENTRDALFAGMQRREVYATSGTRITLRFFAGWGFGKSIENNPQAIALASAKGVPMGGVLRADSGQSKSPTFFAWASADLMSAPLQRMQVIKGWIDANGDTHESVADIICAHGVKVNATTQRCPNNDASVDTSNCQILGAGANQLMVAWHDPNYQPDQSAFYYVRAIQNPTCRWSTYDALRLGQTPPNHVPAVIQERAWSSPIWIEAES